MKNKNSDISFVFFGSSEYSVMVLDELEKAGFLPSLVVTLPDKPRGRGLNIQANPVKTWALNHKIEVLTPLKLDSSFTNTLNAKPCEKNSSIIFSQSEISQGKPYTLFLVVAYGKIIPKAVLDIPKFGTLNLHASLLPKYRGASPIESAILNDEKENGVTIMQIDEQMDHGPILVSSKVQIENWPLKSKEFGKKLVIEGAKLLIEVMPKWIAREIKEIPQNDAEATYCKKIKKENGLLDLNDADPYKNFLKIRAYDGWPGTYYFTERKGKKIRVIVKDAEFLSGELKIKRVLPEGGKEMNYDDFVRGLGKKN